MVNKGNLLWNGGFVLVEHRQPPSASSHACSKQQTTCSKQHQRRSSKFSVTTDGPTRPFLVICWVSIAATNNFCIKLY